MTERAVDQELTWQQQRILNDAYQQNERKLWKAYALALIFGGTGVYRFYLGRKWTAILMFFCNAIGLGTFEYSFTAAHR